MNKRTSYQEMAKEMLEIQQEMLELLERARQRLKDAPGLTRKRAESYWLAHATVALTNQHDYLGGSMVTMEDTICEIKAATEDETEDVED